MNLKVEFLNHVQGRELLPMHDILLCASISHRDNDYCLTTGYTEYDLEDFLKTIDFEYDNGYGGQEIFGMIWYKDGTWSNRAEYDGSEWWSHNKCPDVPSYLIRIDKEREEKLNKILK